MKSLNEGDVFLLLTETELFQWIGHESNGFERAKVGFYLHDHRELLKNVR